MKINEIANGFEINGEDFTYTEATKKEYIESPVLMEFLFIGKARRFLEII